MDVAQVERADFYALFSRHFRRIERLVVRYVTSTLLLRYKGELGTRAVNRSTSGAEHHKTRQDAG